MKMLYPNAIRNINNDSVHRILDAIAHNPDAITEETPLYISFHAESGNIYAVHRRDTYEFLTKTCGLLSVGKLTAPNATSTTIIEGIANAVTCAELEALIQKIEDDMLFEYDETIELRPEVDPAENCKVEIIGDCECETYEYSEDCWPTDIDVAEAIAELYHDEI